MHSRKLTHTWKLFKLFFYNDVESLHSPYLKTDSSPWIKTASVSFKGCSLVCYFKILNHSCFTHCGHELLSPHLPKTTLLISVFCLPVLSLARMTSDVAAIQHTFHFSVFHWAKITEKLLHTRYSFWLQIHQWWNKDPCTHSGGRRKMINNKHKEWIHECVRRQ